MIYIFYFNNISLEEVRAFVVYAETLATYRHCNIDWRKTKTTSEGSVAVLCDKHDYERLFVYLKQRGVLARIEAVPAKMYGRRTK